MTKEDKNEERKLGRCKSNLFHSLLDSYILSYVQEWMTAVPAEPSLVRNGDDGADDTSDVDSNGSFDIVHSRYMLYYA